MKEFILSDSKGLTSLTVRDVPPPDPGPGQVVMRVHAVSLNFRDIMIVNGIYPGVRYPLVPLSDGAGVIEAAGPGVTRVKAGDRVCAIFMQKWLSGRYRAEYSPSSLGGQIDGMLREYVCLPEDGVVTFPAHLSFEEAATLPCAGVTAWNALFESDSLTPGSRVLAQGTGGVSIFSLQFAVAAGAQVLITSSSNEKLTRAKELGASVTINYREQPEWQEEVLKQTGGNGADHVIEVGGADTFQRALQAVAPCGTVSIIGILSGTGTSANLIDFIRKSARAQGIYVGSREMFERMNRMIDTVKLRPVIDRVFPVDKVRDAYQYQMDGKHFGKVVITLRG